MIRVLCLDIEGGHGGSSRSLYQSLRNIDREQVAPEVIVRRGGSIEQMYADLGIPAQVMPELPTANTLQNWRANLRHYVGAAGALWRARRGINALAKDIEARFDAVHFNHEGFWLLAASLRRRTRRPFVGHIRTMGYPFWLTGIQARSIGRTMDQLVFITENERDRFRRAGVRTPGSVVYNIAEPQTGIGRHPAIPNDGKFTIVCLSNFPWERGVDRLIPLAEILAKNSRNDIRFVVAGDMTLPGVLPGALGTIARRGGSLADFTEARGVSQMFLFLGHVSNPEQVLAASHVLIKPTREFNPWGRDVIEAFAAAKPVAAFGTYDTFVEDSKTGILMAEFDADAMASRIEKLSDDRAACAALGMAGQSRVSTLCNGPARARDLVAVWESVVGKPESG
jgi:glycosyltransferase involved in cell wall biosynthesis